MTASAAAVVVVVAKNHQAHHVLSYIFQLLLKHLSEHIHACKHIKTKIDSSSHRTLHRCWGSFNHMKLQNVAARSNRRSTNTNSQMKGNNDGELRTVRRLIDQIKHIDLFHCLNEFVGGVWCCDVSGEHFCPRLYERKMIRTLWEDFIPS